MNTDANSTTSFTDSWFCPACDTEIFEPNHNCHNCGYVRKHCPICKTPVYCQIKVCEKCGAAITNNNQDTTKHEIKTDGSICNTNLQNDSSEVNKRIARTQGENAINFKNNKLIITLVIVAALGFVVTLLFNTINNSGYKKTLNNYFKAHEYPEYYKSEDNPGADLLCNSVFAQYWIDIHQGRIYGQTAEHIRVNLREWECGFNNIKITYKIRGKKRATKEQLEELEEDIYDTYAYNVYERDYFQITDAYVLDIDFTVKGDKDIKTFYYPDGLLIIKENGKWRIPRGRINCSFYDSGFSLCGDFCER